MWYRKFYSTSSDSYTYCPNCSLRYSKQSFYLHTRRACPECKHNLLYLFRPGIYYVFDVDVAPNLFKIMVEYLESKTMKQAHFELFKVLEAFEGHKFYDYDRREIP